MKTVRRLALAVSLCLLAPSADAAIFSLIDTGEIYSSGNAGATWTPLAALPVHDAVGLAAGASTSELFVMTRSGTVYRSTNGGAAWSAVGAITASDVAAFTINYDASVLALTESGTLYRSTNGGSTFTGYAALTGSNFVSLARGPLGRLYALARSGEVYESTNQGTAWTAVGSVTVANAVSIRRKVAELYLLTETGEIYRSINYGRAWTPVGAITASNMRAILDVGSTLLAGAETGEVYASSTGATWAAVGAVNQLRLRALGADTPLATGVPLDETAPKFVVHAPYPNPALSSRGSTFGFELASPGTVRLELYDVAGRLVGTRGPIAFSTAGRHEIAWRPSRLSAGAYMVRLVTESGRTAVTRWSVLK